MKSYHNIKKRLVKDCEKIIDTMYKKSVDYCTVADNIAVHGISGVAVRLNDKVSRLVSLADRTRNPNFESIDDTIKDMIGYCLICLMLRNGDWKSWRLACGGQIKIEFKIVGIFLSGKPSIKNYFRLYTMIRKTNKHKLKRSNHCYVSHMTFIDFMRGLLSNKFRKNFIENNNRITSHTSNSVVSDNIHDKRLKDKSFNHAV